MADPLVIDDLTAAVILPTASNATMEGPSTSIGSSSKHQAAGTTKPELETESDSVEIPGGAKKKARFTDSTEYLPGAFSSNLQLTKANEPETESLSDPDERGYEIRSTESQLGDGMFATKDFQPNTIILSAPYLLSVEEFRFHHASDKDQYLVNSIAKLSTRDKEYVRQLSPIWDVVNMFNAHAFFLQDIFMTRRMYRDICKINHACKPNAVLYHNKDGVGELRAKSNIYKGMQICIHYLSAGIPKEMVEEQYGFSCYCFTCQERGGFRVGTPSTAATGHISQPGAHPGSDVSGKLEAKKIKGVFKRVKYRVKRACKSIDIRKVLPRRTERAPFYQQNSPPPPPPPGTIPPAAAGLL